MIDLLEKNSDRLLSNTSDIISNIEKLNGKVEIIRKKSNSITKALGDFATRKSLNLDKSIEYLNFQEQIMLNEKNYYKKIKTLLIEKLYSDLYSTAEYTIMLLSSLDNLDIENNDDKKNVLHKMVPIKNLGKKSINNIKPLVSSINTNLELISKLINLFDNFIQKTNKENTDNNLHCNNYYVSLNNKCNHMILQHNKNYEETCETIEYFLKFSNAISEQLDNEKIFDFLCN